MTNWPWPLGGVQSFFESLWNWISTAAVNAVSVVSGWIWGAIYWVKDRIWDFSVWLRDRVREIVNVVLGWIWGAIIWVKDRVFEGIDWLWGKVAGGLTWLFNTIWEVIYWVKDRIWEFSVWIRDSVGPIVGQVSGWIWGAIYWVKDRFWEFVDWLSKWIQTRVEWISERLNNTRDHIVTKLTTAFDGGLTGIPPSIDLFRDVFKNFGKSPDIPGLQSGIDGTISKYASQYASIFKPKSPKTPEDAFSDSQIWEPIVNTAYVWISGALMAAEAISLGQIDVTLMSLLNTPVLQSWFGTGRKMAEVRDEAGVIIPLRQYWLKQFTPIIPDPQDLIRFVVREVIKPEKFYELMPYHGYSSTIAKWFWEVHWILLPLGEVKNARYRGLIDDSELETYLVLHDYKPEPRPGIRTADRDLAAKLIWDLPGRIDTRWMFRWGLIPPDKIEELLIKSGIDPDWAPVVAEAYAKQQVATDISRLRDNIKADLAAGYIDEATARADLAELGYPPEWVDFHIQDALADRQRKHKKDLISYYTDLYYKDVITEDELRAYLGPIIVIPEVLELEIEKVNIRKYKPPKVAS